MQILVQTKLHTLPLNAQFSIANSLIINKKLCNKIFFAQCAILPLNQSCYVENLIPTNSPEQGPVFSTGGAGGYLLPVNNNFRCFANPDTRQNTILILAISKQYHRSIGWRLTLIYGRNMNSVGAFL